MPDSAEGVRASESSSAFSLELTEPGTVSAAVSAAVSVAASAADEGLDARSEWKGTHWSLIER